MSQQENRSGRTVRHKLGNIPRAIMVLKYTEYLQRQLIWQRQQLRVFSSYIIQISKSTFRLRQNMWDVTLNWLNKEVWRVSVRIFKHSKWTWNISWACGKKKKIFLSLIGWTYLKSWTSGSKEKKPVHIARRFHYLNTLGYKTFYSANT